MIICITRVILVVLGPIAASKYIIRKSANSVFSRNHQSSAEKSHRYFMFDLWAIAPQHKPEIMNTARGFGQVLANTYELVES